MTGAVVLTNVFTSHLTTSFTGLGLPGSVARSIATDHDTSFSMQGGLNVGAAINSAIQHDFATGIQAVLIGMSIALGVSFVVALRHPGRQAFEGNDTAELEEAPPVAESA